MTMVQYMLDRGIRVLIPGVEAVHNDVETAEEPLVLALEQELEVTTGHIKELLALAWAEADPLGEQFMPWFLKEQVEQGCFNVEPPCAMLRARPVASLTLKRSWRMNGLAMRGHEVCERWGAGSPEAAGGAL